MEMSPNATTLIKSDVGVYEGQYSVLLLQDDTSCGSGETAQSAEKLHDRAAGKIKEWFPNVS
jgi:hypothetical protein